MKNRVLFSTLMTRRRGKIACPPGARAARFGKAGPAEAAKTQDLSSAAAKLTETDN